MKRNNKRDREPQAEPGENKRTPLSDSPQTWSHAVGAWRRAATDLDVHDKMMDGIMTSSDNRARTLESLRESILAGTYRISPEAIAERIIDKHLRRVT